MQYSGLNNCYIMNVPLNYKATPALGLSKILCSCLYAKYYIHLLFIQLQHLLHVNCITHVVQSKTE